MLLLLTELRPWQIVLQKYAGGLVPMLTFLMLGMPLAAIAYAFVVSAISSFSAILRAHHHGAPGRRHRAFLLGMVPHHCQRISRHLLSRRSFLRGTSRWRCYAVTELFNTPVGVWMGHMNSFEYPMLLFALIPIEVATESGLNPFSSPGVVWKLIPSLLSIPVFLGLAHFALVRRSFAPRRISFSASSESSTVS